MTFEELGITRQFLDAIHDSGYTQPTAIQIQAIPSIRSGQHVIGIAQTGTGKTAAYLLPILQLLKFAQGWEPRCIILVPTKELVVQVTEQIAALVKYTDLRFTGIYGGVGRKAQAKKIHEGLDLLVSTPRRLLELYQEEGLSVKKLQILVLDEADRMMDMGFMPQINLVLDIAPRKKQNLLFSATFSPRVEELSWNFMDFPIKIEITPEATPVETVSQVCYHVPNIQTKLNLLDYLLLDEEAFNRVIVFVKTKQSADAIAQHLDKKVKGEMRLIHSNKSQNARINSFHDFKEGNVRILISTDVMARGVDIPEVSHVINFDVTLMPEDYVHRIGRTGRAFKLGSAITFVTKSDVFGWEKIEKKIRMVVPVLEIPEKVTITETPFEENQKMDKEIDDQKRKADPTYQGAFHDKKHFQQKRNDKERKKSHLDKRSGGTAFVSSKPKTNTTSKYNRKK